MNDRYNPSKISGQAVRSATCGGRFSLGLIGFPLDHSLSPQIHSAALKSLELEGEYHLYPIPPLPNAKTELIDLLDQVKNGRIHGLNITIPHKQNIIHMLDELTPTAKTIGAVNTIYRKGDLLIGDNTDAAGFWTDLKHITDPSTSPSGVRVRSSKPEALRTPHPTPGTPHSALILGAGGSARAVTYALLSNGYYVTIAARRIEQGREISDQYSVFSNQLRVIELENCPLTTYRYSLIVNTTSVGMHPHVNSSPWPDGTPFPENVSIYDLIYNPSETLLVKQAKAVGLPARTGLGMLIEQAALAFQRWTGLEAPRLAMQAAVKGGT